MFYLTQDLSPHMEAPCDERENWFALENPPNNTAKYTSYTRNHLVHRTLPKTRFNVSYK